MDRRTLRKKPFPGDPRDPESLTAWTLRYLRHLETMHSSPKTLEVRHQVLRLFLVWCHERGLTRPGQVTRPILQRYQRHVFLYRKPSGKPLAISTQRTRMTMLRALFRWLTREDAILSNPAADLDLPRLPRSLPKNVLTPEEVEAILAVPDLEDLLGLRDRAMLEVFYATGVRRSELAKLGLYDADLGRETLRVMEGKGRKDRVVPLGPRASWWLERYLNEVRPLLSYGPESGALFLTRDGGPFTPGALGAVVRNYVQEANLGKTGACHLFRHAMATAMLEGGADVRYVQEMLGHAQLSTTQIYTHVSIRKLQEIHRATHPGVRLQREPGEALLEDELAGEEPETARG